MKREERHIRSHTLELKNLVEKRVDNLQGCNRRVDDRMH
jgi:hypothetical protein